MHIAQALLIRKRWYSSKNSLVHTCMQESEYGSKCSPNMSHSTSAILLLSSQLVARGGISVSAVFNYQLTPKLSTEVCFTKYKIRVKNCVGIYHQWVNNRIILDVWYQLRKVKWCKKWGIPYVSSKAILYSDVTCKKRMK